MVGFDRGGLKGEKSEAVKNVYKVYKYYRILPLVSLHTSDYVNEKLYLRLEPEYCRFTITWGAGSDKAD
jgi:hypothetical protein